MDANKLEESITSRNLSGVRQVLMELQESNADDRDSGLLVDDTLLGGIDGIAEDLRFQGEEIRGEGVITQDHEEQRTGEQLLAESLQWEVALAELAALNRRGASGNDRLRLPPTFEMVDIPAGGFIMGSPDSEIGHKENESQVEVQISKSFQLSRTVVKQDIPLDGLERIAPDTAHVLAKKSGSALQLNGITWLTPDAAKALATYQGIILELNGVERLDVAEATQLANYRGHLKLKGLTTVTAEVARAFATGRVQSVVCEGISELSEDALIEVLESGKIVIPARFRSPIFKLQRGKWYQKAKSYRNDGGRWVPDGGGAGIAWEFLDDGRVHIYDGDEVDQSYRWEILSKNEETKVTIKYWSVTSLPDEFATWEFVFASDLRSAEVERVRYAGGKIDDSAEATWYCFP